MTTIFPGFGNVKQSVNAMTDDNCIDANVVAITDADVGGVRVVTATWSAFNCVLDGLYHYVEAGHLHLNAVDVASPTTYYIYFEDVAGVPTAKASTTNPAINPLVDEYFVTNVLRFKSVGGVATYYFNKYPSQDGIYELVHNLKENVLFYDPKWISGIAPTLSAGGKISTDAGYVRFVGDEPRPVTAITNGAIMPDDESGVVVGLDNITTYSGAGGAITATKFVKILVGLLRDKGSINAGKFIAVRQSKPSAEYATRAAALADAEKCAATSFGESYLGAVTPLFYVITQMGAGATSDYTQGGAYPAGDIIDLRATGLNAGGGGGAGVTDHSLLSNLNVVADHPGYLAIDGSRALTGDWAAGAKNITSTGAISANTLVSTVAIGTAPITTTSTTMCTNVNADRVDGIEGAEIVQRNGSVTMTGALNMGTKGITNAGGVATTTITATGASRAVTYQATQATGSAPLIIASTTKCTNLNADLLDGIEGAALLKADGTTPLTADWDAGPWQIRAETFQSDVATGTAPFTVASTTVVPNLNASSLQGNAASAFAVAAKGVTNGDTHDHSGGDGAQIAHSTLSGLTAPADDHTQYLLADGTRALSGNWSAGSKSITTTSNLSGSQIVSTIADGTAPFVVTSKTVTANLNADMLDGLHSTAMLLADGSQNLTGNLSVTGGVTIDGVDISAHAANINAHHTIMTISDDLNSSLLSLTDQALDLDTQTATYVYAGPASGAAAKPSFRALAVTDIPRQPSAALTLANTGNDNVAVTERKSVVYITGPTSNFAVTGFIMGGANVDGMVLRLHNGTAKTMTLTNDATSTTTNRIYSGGKTVAAGNGCTLVYNASVSRWLLAS